MEEGCQERVQSFYKERIKLGQNFVPEAVISRELTRL